MSAGYTKPNNQEIEMKVTALELKRTGVMVIVSDGKGIIATFTENKLGLNALSFFCDGLARRGSCSLFDLDAQRYLVGDPGELDQSQETNAL